MLDPLAELMHTAYKDSCDDEGESPEQARLELAAWFSGKYGRPLAEQSLILTSKEEFLSACLVSEWDDPLNPLICYIMTDPLHKKNGLAGSLLKSVCNRLYQHKLNGVRAVITDGNIPSELLFESCGFVRS